MEFIRGCGVCVFYSLEIKIKGIKDSKIFTITMYQTQCIQVANVVRVFAQQVKQIIHDNTFDYVFEVGENSM